MLLVLGMVDVSMLFVHRQLAQNGVEVLAKLAAYDLPGWRNQVDDENQRTHCRANPLQPDVSYPQGNEPGRRLVVTWHCHYRSVTGILPDIGITVTAGSVVEGPAPTPTPEVTP